MKKSKIIFTLMLMFGITNLSLAAPKGHLFIIGGGKRLAYIMKKFVQLAGDSKANIAIIPVASSKPLDTALYQKYQLEKQGAKQVDFRIFNYESADADSNISLLNKVTGIFFSGGNQNRLTKALLGTKMLEKIIEIYNSGGVIGGTSAGAAVMSNIMLTGDEFKNPDSSRHFHTIMKGNIVTSEGFGFVSNAIIDQHFIKRKRNNRLISVVLENPDLLGIGIDESTAIIINPNDTFEVLGENTVIVYDASEANNIEIDKNENFSASGIIMNILKTGDKYNLSSRQVIK